MTPLDRDRLVKRGLWLAALTITWNVIEAVVAISAGIAAGSLALVAFGFDSIIEVLSADTERTDRREKFLSYTRIETLEEYVLIAQDHAEVTIFRRANEWRPEIVTGLEEALRLPSINFTLPLATVYENVKV